MKSRSRSFRPVALLLGLLVVLASSVRADTRYLFVPGHGLTNKSANSAITTDELIAECKDTGPWMRFVEREYPWKALQADGAGGPNEPGPYLAGTNASGRPVGISEIIADAKKCAAAGLKLRVMLMHKFAPLPAYLTRGQTYAVPISTINGRPASYNIKLDRPEVLGFLAFGLGGLAAAVGFLTGVGRGCSVLASWS